MPLQKNPCQKVRETCLEFYERQNHVEIQSLRQLTLDVAAHEQIHWDEEEWHYQPPQSLKDRDERIALYILALDAINFCFWPTPGYEYEDLATTLTKLAQKDEHSEKRYIFSPTSLANMTHEKMREHFLSVHDKIPPNLETRCLLWNEVGNMLLQHFDGQVLKLLNGQNSAVALTQTLIEYCAGFRDYTSDGLYFLKRAQICVGDWNAALALNLPDMDQLTTFADYRVPQLLREVGVLKYSPELAALVDSKEELVKDSWHEWSIRAATVVAVERLVLELQTIAPDRAWTAVQVDWLLWQIGEKRQQRGELRPHHRVRTIYY